jgi:hypothetical protein
MLGRTVPNHTYSDIRIYEAFGWDLALCFVRREKRKE